MWMGDRHQRPRAPGRAASSDVGTGGVVPRRRALGGWTAPDGGLQPASWAGGRASDGGRAGGGGRAAADGGRPLQLTLREWRKKPTAGSYADGQMSVPSA
jgi:hypothetical protein